MRSPYKSNLIKDALLSLSPGKKIGTINPNKRKGYSTWSNSLFKKDLDKLAPENRTVQFILNILTEAPSGTQQSMGGIPTETFFMVCERLSTAAGFVSHRSESLLMKKILPSSIFLRCGTTGKDINYSRWEMIRTLLKYHNQSLCSMGLFHFWSSSVVWNNALKNKSRIPIHP